MKRSFLCASLLLMCLFLAGSRLASEVELPRRMAAPPGMVLAKMTPSGDLVLRMVDTEMRRVPYTATNFTDVERIVNEVLQQEKIPFAETTTKMARVATGWRKVTIGQSVPYGFFDIKGMPVTRAMAAKHLAKEAPVFLSVEPIERFHLLTAKEDCLILVVPVFSLLTAMVGPTSTEVSGEEASAGPAGTAPFDSKPRETEFELPKLVGYPPATALARISQRGDLNLRLIEVETKGIASTIPSYCIRERMVNGTVQREVAQIHEESGMRQRPVPVGWRRGVLVGEGSKRVFDVKGKAVTWEKAVEKFANETPVLIHFEPVEPFQLLTAKEDTLVVIVPKDLFAKTPPGQSFPAVPVGESVPPGSKVADDIVAAPDRLSLPKPNRMPSQSAPTPNAADSLLPRPGLVYLETGFAQATDNDAVVVKMVDYASPDGLQKAKHEPVNQAKPREAIVTANFKIDNFNASTPNPKKWRLLALKRGEAGFAMHDRQGNTIPWGKAREVLEQETPVLLSTAPIDPLKLSVMKEDAVVLVIPARLLYPEVRRGLPTPLTSPFAKPTPAKPSEPPTENP